MIIIGMVGVEVVDICMVPMSLPLISSVCLQQVVRVRSPQESMRVSQRPSAVEYRGSSWCWRDFAHVRGGVRVMINVRFSVAVSATVFSATVIFAKVSATANKTVFSVTVSLTASLTVGRT